VWLYCRQHLPGQRMGQKGRPKAGRQDRQICLWPALYLVCSILYDLSLGKSKICPSDLPGHRGDRPGRSLYAPGSADPASELLWKCMEIQSSESGLAELDSEDSLYHKSAGPGLYGNRSLDQRKDPMDLSDPGAGIPGAFPGLYLEKVQSL